MKKLLLFSLLLAISTRGFSQKINWVRNVSQKGWAVNTITDPSSNLYLFSYHQTYYPDPSEGSSIRKFSPGGVLLFDIDFKAKIFIKDMLHDGSGSIYFCGYYRDTVNTNGISLVSEGRTDGFLGKMDEQGQVQWAFGFGGMKDDVASALTFNSDSTAIVLTGGVDSTVFLHDYPIITTGKAIFLASFDMNGGLLTYKTYAFLTKEYGKNVGLEIGANANGYFLLADRMGDHWNNYPPSGSPQAGRYLFSLDHNFNINWSQFIISEGCYYGYTCENMSVCNGDAYVPSFCSGKYGGTGLLRRLESNAGATTFTLNNEDGTYYDTEAVGRRVFYVGNEEANGCPCEDNNPGYAKVKVLDENNNDEVLLKKYGFHFYNIAHARNGTIYVYGHTNDGEPSLEGQEMSAGFFVFSMQSPSTNIEQMEAEMPLLSIFPNPSQGNMKVLSENQIDELSIVDMNGTVVLRTTPVAKECNVAGLSAGCYAVRVKSGDSYSVSKIVVTE